MSKDSVTRHRMRVFLTSRILPTKKNGKKRITGIIFETASRKHSDSRVKNMTIKTKIVKPKKENKKYNKPDLV